MVIMQHGGRWHHQALWPQSRQVKWTVVDNACLSSLTDIKPFNKMGVTNNKYCIPVRSSVNYKDLVWIWLLNICRGSPCNFFQVTCKTSIDGLNRLFLAFWLLYFVKRSYNASKLFFINFESLNFFKFLFKTPVTQLFWLKFPI